MVARWGGGELLEGRPARLGLSWGALEFLKESSGDLAESASSPKLLKRYAVHASVIFRGAPMATRFLGPLVATTMRGVDGFY